MTCKNLAKLPLVGVAAVEGFVAWFEMFFNCYWFGRAVLLLGLNWPYSNLQ